MSDIGNRCVHCGEDTSFGSGRFVNRIGADADYESTDSEGKIIFAEGEYRDGYACPPCMAMPCDRCDELIAVDEDICPYDVYAEDDKRSRDAFSDGAWRVHEGCLTKQERVIYK
jgi:hypothetical protein|tara:strand:- start:76 stop:417 length:342 start_codon:yes stop_codon:yes gene_type:complete